MRAEYKNSIRSKKLIREAVKTLLIKKKDLNKITVSDIVKEANINRGTFYNHYNNIGDVIEETEDILMQKFTQSWEKSSNENDSVANFMNSITYHLKESEADYKAIINYIPRYIFIEIKDKILKEIGNNYLKSNEITNDKRITLYILANGIAGSYIDYFQKKLNITLDELNNESIVLIEKILY
ncbi:MAG: TetR/AcrR family transcriptional regulator [Bacilli bacterium]